MATKTKDDKRLTIYLPVPANPKPFQVLHFGGLEGLENTLIKKIEFYTNPKAKTYQPSDTPSVLPYGLLIESNVTLVGTNGLKYFDRLPLGFLSSSRSTLFSPCAAINFEPFPINKTIDWRKSFITVSASTIIDYGVLMAVHY